MSSKFPSSYKWDDIPNGPVRGKNGEKLETGEELVANGYPHFFIGWGETDLKTGKTTWHFGEKEPSTRIKENTDRI